MAAMALTKETLVSLTESYKPAYSLPSEMPGDVDARNQGLNQII